MPSANPPYAAATCTGKFVPGNLRLTLHWETPMPTRLSTLTATSLAAFCFVAAHAANAQAPVALAGQVSSAKEGTMEGVVVSAKRAGGTITVSAVSDGKGHYSFPAAKLVPGQYALAIRAVGYELDGPKTAEVAAGKPTTADI